mgnify:CR=1 FL=1
MRILLIEDDERLSKSIPEMLRSNGHAVDVALDGLLGEEYAEVNLYDAILLDVMLPKQDGWTTCRNLRKSGVLTPILMLGATYLCFEGAEKIWEKVSGHDAGEEEPAVVQGGDHEQTMVAGAIRTDLGAHWTALDQASFELVEAVRLMLRGWP